MIQSIAGWIEECDVFTPKGLYSTAQGREALRAHPGEMAEPKTPTPKGLYRGRVKPLRGTNLFATGFPGCAPKLATQPAHGRRYKPVRHRIPRVRSQSLATLGCGVQPLRGR